MKTETMSIRMPDLGDISSAVVVQWLQPIGAAVQEGDDLLEIETEKTTFVVPEPATGRLSHIHAAESANVAVGDVLGEIDIA